MSHPNEAQDQPIGENSSVKLGVIGFCIMVFVGVLGIGVGGVWFASSMSTKLDQIAEEIKGIRIIDMKVNDHETRIRLIEQKTK